MTEQTIFLAALEIADPVERAACVVKACAGDVVLRQQVEALLAAHERPGAFLNGPADRRDRTGDHVAAPDAPERLSSYIGPYRLLQRLGEGGMGTVWMAEQTHPVQRKVALKIIKPGMDSRQVIVRFEAERQALALMDHVNIARVLDVGTTETGLPYFVMELVHGLPITKYCDDNRLTPRQRLELFVPVCQAIQHAHQKGIIHRDIKPSNVMITLYDGKPVPKVIDFGVAKAIEQRLTERTLFTQYGTLVGTLEYMSPEQAEMSALGVDTRCDIFSLGVLLYELLTGGTPLSHKRVKEAAYGEVLRMIRDEEPPRPSTRLSDSGEALASISAQRHTEPGRLAKLVRGELDWIVIKTLEKDRNRRYETVNGFAADVQRYLNDEPVQACPPSAGYRLKKFVRRNKRPVLAAALVFLAVLAGAGVATWQAIRATQAEAIAREEESKAIQERDEKEKARVAEAEQAQRAQTAEKLAKLRLLEVTKEKERATTAETHAKEEAATAKKRLAQIEKGNEILGSIFKDLDPHWETKNGTPLRWLLGERLEAAARQLDGEAVGDPPAVARLQLTLGGSLLGLGYPDKAIDLLAKARATFTIHLGADHPDTLRCMNDLASGYQAAGKLDLALPLYVETLRLTKLKLGPGHPDTLTSMNNLAAGYLAAKKLDLALPLLETTLGWRKAKLGPDHPDTLASMHNLATGYQAAGKPDLALPLLEESLKRMKTKPGADTFLTMNNLAMGYLAAKKLDLALPLLEETLKLRTAKLGPDHPDTLSSMYNLAGGYQTAGKLDLALPLFQQASAGVEKRQFVHKHAGLIVGNVSLCHEALNQYDQAEVWRRKWLAVVKERSGGESSAYACELAPLGSNLLKQKKFADAELILRECLTIRAKIEPDAWTTFNTESLLGGALLYQKKYAEAEPLLLAGYAGIKQREATIPPQVKEPRLREAVERLVQLYEATGQEKKAAAWRKKLDARTEADRKTEKQKEK